MKTIYAYISRPCCILVCIPDKLFMVFDEFYKNISYRSIILYDNATLFILRQRFIYATKTFGDV